MTDQNCLQGFHHLVEKATHLQKKQNKRISGHTNSIQQFIEGNRMMLMYLTWLIMQQIDAYTTRYQQSME